MDTDRTFDRRTTLLLARAEAIEAYSRLESTLVMWFMSLAGLEPDVAGLIFYRLINTRSRLSIIEDLFRRKFEAEFNLFRNSVFKHLQEIDSERNKIAHWTAQATFTAGSKEAGIKATIHDYYLLQPTMWWEPDRAGVLRAEDLERFHDRCSAVSTAMTYFQHLNLMPITGLVMRIARETLQEIFSRPLPFPLPEDHPLYWRPSTQQNQPPPSSE